VIGSSSNSSSSNGGSSNGSGSCCSGRSLFGLLLLLLLVVIAVIALISSRNSFCFNFSYILFVSSAGIEKQKFVYVMNRDSSNKLTISSPLEVRILPMDPCTEQFCSSDFVLIAGPQVGDDFVLCGRGGRGLRQPGLCDD
jgi:hypothetical protein